MAKSEIDAALAAESRNGRKAMGNTASKLSNVAQPLRGTLRPKGHSKDGQDPSVGTQAHRGQIMAERLGARYAIGVAFESQQAPEAGNTQAKGRIVRGMPGINRNFRDQSSRMG